nr:MerR family transcriptional regulator [uncultured Celeribacter sp.]
MLMVKSPDAFRTISEVSEWLDTPAHVLRFWESRFTQVKPVKRAGGRRYYRPSDMALLGGIKKLLHEDGMTIRGVQKLLREHGVKYVAAMSQPVEGAEAESPTQDAAPAPVAPPAPMAENVPHDTFDSPAPAVTEENIVPFARPERTEKKSAPTAAAEVGTAADGALPGQSSLFDFGFDDSTRAEMPPSELPAAETLSDEPTADVPVSITSDEAAPDMSSQATEESPALAEARPVSPEDLSQEGVNGQEDQTAAHRDADGPAQDTPPASTGEAVTPHHLSALPRPEITRFLARAEALLDRLAS